MSLPDVVVVGAGVVGISVGLHLQERGARVRVLEREGVSAGQSGIQPGGVRLQFGTAVNCALARESMAFWKGAAERFPSPVPLGFSACGYLFLAHTSAVRDRLAALVAVQNAEGVPSRIVEPAEAAALVPGLEADGLAGASWCDADGYMDEPQATIEALARHVAIEIADVRSVTPAGGGWRLETSSGPVEAGAVVLAAGARSRELLAPLGVELPIVEEARHLFLSAPLRERLLEPLVISPERHFAAKQLASGRVLASDLSAAGDPEAGRAGWLANVRAACRELLPVLSYVDFDVLASGDYDLTPDRQPVLGPVPGHPGLHVAAGFSGHGFMIAPAVGRVVAAGVAGEDDPVLRVLDVARFTEGRPVPEPAVI